MHPEYITYLDSPHARVSCAECHVGTGANWYVKSKLSGAYQIYATIAQKYPKPIPTPIKNLRPAQETCYKRNIFPEMGVKWSIYPDNVGHLDFPGCFRCHDNKHVTEYNVSFTENIIDNMNWELIIKPICLSI